MVPDGGQGSRTALRNAGAGEIVEVPGGRIVRSAAGRKDRHSKVCTAKGPRDRRVRLAAHTAIQFYDVQDRLGYDRPSKAVDWLMKKAKSAIDALDELPTWKPISKNPDEEAAEVYGSNLLPPSMESDSIADTIKSFFPVGGEGSAAGAVSPVGVQSMQFQSFPSSDFLSPRDCNKSQDLKLSLQSLQDPMMMQSHHNNPRHSHQNQEEEQQSQFSEAAQIGFGNPSAGWDAEPQQQPDSGRFQRLIGWNLGGYGGGESGGGFMFIPPQNSLQQHPLLFSHGGGHSSSHLFSQGGPLQSNITTSATTTNSSQDHHHDHSVSIQPVSFPGITFSGFRMPARIQGDEEEQDGIPGKPFSLSSGSRH